MRKSILFFASVISFSFLQPCFASKALQNTPETMEAVKVYFILSLYPQALTLDIAKELSNQLGPNFSAMDKPTLLCLAATSGNLEAVHYLLEQGAHPQLQSGLLNRTPLHCAATAPIAEILLKAGTNIHTTDDNGSSPLHSAARLRTPETPLLIQKLIQAGADMKPNRFGETPLFGASAEAIPVLLNHFDVKIDTKNKNGNTALDHSLSYHSGDKGEDLKAIKLLLELGANPNSCSPSGRSLLERSIEDIQKDLDIAMLLLERGADPTKKMNPDQTIGDRILQDPEMQRKLGHFLKNRKIH